MRSAIFFPLTPATRRAARSANAGAQMTRRRCFSSRPDLLLRSHMIWVPAFAGMSGFFEP